MSRVEIVEGSLHAVLLFLPPEKAHVFVVKNYALHKVDPTTVALTCGTASKLVLLAEPRCHTFFSGNDCFLGSGFILLVFVDHTI